jgi:hypothetical protein
MLPRADLNTNRPPASLEAATTVVSSTDTRLEIFRRLNQIAIGRELQATVDAMLDDGSFLVKVADTTARMALPVGTKVGDTLAMVLVAKEPRPTFLMTQQGSAPTLLSDTARLIDHLVQTAEQNGAPTAVVAKAPLLASSTALEPQKVATALQNSLTSSGLFYESHLHEWISGNRPQADLAREPQAQMAGSWHQPANPAMPNDSANINLAQLAANMRELGDSTQKLVNLIQEAQVQAGPTAKTDADVITATQSALPTVESDTARMINLQLNTLEHQTIRWHGELWPGQPMDWEISEDKPEGGDGSGEAPQAAAWTSVVRFELPNLGEISATVRLVGERVHVQVGTSTDDTASALRQYGGMLADSLEAAGAPLDSLLVKRDETP